MSDYKDDLLADLADPEYAAHYVTGAYRESRGTFLIALKDVADAMFGMSKLAESVKSNRVSLYRALSKGGNPTLSTFTSIIDALNLDVCFSPRIPMARASTRKRRRLSPRNAMSSKTKTASGGTSAKSGSKRVR
jgi:probable addiction module antidote protein